MDPAQTRERVSFELDSAANKIIHVQRIFRLAIQRHRD